MPAKRTSTVGLALFYVAAVLLVEVSLSSEQNDVPEIKIPVSDTTTVHGRNDVNLDIYGADNNDFASHLYSQPERRVRPWRQSHGRHRRAKDDGVCELEIFCGSGRGGEERTSSGVVRLPIRGQRGPPGPPGPPGEKGQKGQDGNGAAGVGQSAGSSLAMNYEYIVTEALT